MNTDIIRVTQLPIIEEQLLALEADVDRRVTEAMALACTPETIQDVKKARAELNKAFSDLEERRKEVKKAVLGPYEAFEAIYRKCVSNKFKSADLALKNKIDDVEREIKRQCEDGLREYFAELCAVNHLDWLAYGRANIKVDMSSAKQKTPKKLREQIAAFVTGVAREAETLADMKDAEELLAEYRQRLDISDAIRVVEDRHRRIEAERERMEAFAAAQKAQQEAVEKVEAVAPPVIAEPPTEAEKEYRCTFTVYATKDKLKALKQYMIQEGIRYE